ncbi:MAG: hypothetical protein ACREJ3_06885 [Polyangiaceae bacterium]
MSFYWLGAGARTRRACATRRFDAALTAIGIAVIASGCGTVTAADLAPGDDASAEDSTAAGAALLDGQPGGACQPGDVETYLPGPYVAAAPAWQGVCVGTGADLIELFYDACLGGSASPTTCATFKAASTANAACAACIVAPMTATRFGPVINYGSFADRNTAGCIELTDPNGLPCAKAVEALLGCERAACAANCPVGDAASLTAYRQCATAADAVGCKSYAAMASCQGRELDGGPASLCEAASFKFFYDAVVPLFCGQQATYFADAGALADSSAEGGSGLDAARDGSGDAVADAPDGDAGAD